MSEAPENATLTASETRKTNWKTALRDILETLILAAVLYLGINAVSARVRVDGSSMLPTLEDGELVVVNRLAYVFGAQAKRGDIVVFDSPLAPEEDLIKRVIGLSGDEIKIEAGQVYINGTPLEEPYISESPAYSGIWQIEDGCVFVLGDNRNDSSDSHSWGPLATKDIVGKAILIYWPLSKISLITHNAPETAGR